MQVYTVAATENTPEVVLNHTQNRILFKGESRPEDVQKFYNPVMAWMNDYENYLYFLKDQNSGDITMTCEFMFEYFNSSSAKYIMDIIQKLSSINKTFSNVKLVINWYSDAMDEDMLDAGKEFEDMLGLPFNFKTLN